MCKPIKKLLNPLNGLKLADPLLAHVLSKNKKKSNSSSSSTPSSTPSTTPAPGSTLGIP